jgi:two-component system OmpR family sensor kinase
VKLTQRLRGLSIFGRTFLLMLAALAIADGIGLTLLINRPPIEAFADPGRPPDRDDRGPPFGPAPPGFHDDNFGPGGGPDHGPPPHWIDRSPQAPQSFPTALQKQALLLFVISLATLLPLAWIFAQALAAPIKRFSEAATRIGTDPNAPPLPLEGPKEMLLAVDSFNAMQVRLNRLLQERTQMISAIAHDLRTPLTRLAFRLDDLPAPLSDKVNADIEEMKSMISAALDFLRDRTLSIRRERLDFRLLVESVVDDQSDLGYDVTLQSGTPITIVGDPLGLRRAVVNLVENAIKYGERARLRLQVANERCTLQIDDDGPGIPDAQQNRVFEPFFRLESSRNRDTGGVGLGLAVVRATITDHGGEISLNNRKEGGLRAALWLPIVHG